ncbi:hypothetical protein J3R83DRAFT_8306 [Lanmaoa asiatica]|nr:hypothetical protein J3R83DRAFT_8306 [Lanmaoa asiatica]
MCDNPSDVVHQPIFNDIQPLLDPSAEPLPEAIVLSQYFQNSYSSRNCFYKTDPRVALDPSDSWVAIPDDSRIQDIAAQWPTSAMSQFPPRELSAPNSLTVSYWSGTNEVALATEYRPTFTEPATSRIELPGTETSHDKSGISLHSSPTSPGGLSTSIGSTSESPSQAGNQSSSQECYTQWKKIPVDAIVVTGSNRFVPQTLYKPFTEADKERYLERVSLSPPIIFVTKAPNEWGVSLEDVRNGKTNHLVDKNAPVLQNCGPSVSIRINWPGYSPFKRQISSRNWRKTKGPITKEKLAQILAKTTSRFIEVG